MTSFITVTKPVSAGIARENKQIVTSLSTEMMSMVSINSRKKQNVASYNLESEHHQHYQQECD